MAHDQFVQQAGLFIPPVALAQLVMMELKEIAKDDFFNNPAHQPLKDAWQGAILATGYEEVAGREVKVRLSSMDQFPDIQIRDEGRVLDFEAVMALNKPLGKIYKGDMSTGPVALSRPERLPSLDLGPLRNAVKAKVRKNYAGKVNLSVYMNYSGSNAEFEKVSVEVLAAAQDKFESVWLIARGNFSGAADEGAFFICCVKESPDLPKTGAWYKVKRLVGGRL
jgi:hypothetical protein